MYQVKEVEGQIYTNRIRKNVARIMESRGMAGSKGLPSLSHQGLYLFIAGKSDMTVTRVQQIADDLGVSIFELMQSG